MGVHIQIAFCTWAKCILSAQVRHSPTVGRYLVAARDIEPLELVLWDRSVDGSDRSSLRNRMCYYRSSSSNFLKSHPSQCHNLMQCMQQTNTTNNEVEAHKKIWQYMYRLKSPLQIYEGFNDPIQQNNISQYPQPALLSGSFKMLFNMS